MMKPDRLISVTGPGEGVFSLHKTEDGITGAFTVRLLDSSSPKTAVLYRLRVKTTKTTFSKTYGLIDGTPAGSSDVITLFAKPDVVKSGRVPPVRVEYVVVSQSEAETLRAMSLEKTVCRPLFYNNPVYFYDVSCQLEGTSRWLLYAVAAGTVAATLAAAAYYVRGRAATAPAASASKD